MVEIMVQIGLKTIVILPDPATIFSNLSRPRPSRETSSVTTDLKTFKEWLEIVPLRETHPHLIIFQGRDIDKNPMLVAKALAQLDFANTKHAQSDLDLFYCYAKCMIPEMMERCYGEGFYLEPEITNEAALERQARIQALIEQNPIVNEIRDLHRNVVSSLQD